MITFELSEWEVNEMCAEILKLEAEGARISKRREYESPVYYDKRRRRIKELQQKLANEFGRCCGWNLSHRRFSVECLRLGKVRHYEQGPVIGINCGVPHPYWDHPYFYREPGTTRAAGVAAHLGKLDDNLGRPDDDVSKAMDWAKANGLGFHIPDFPSWYYPGRCLLVVYYRVQPERYG